MSPTLTPYMQFKLKFCWAQSLPFEICVDGKIVEVNRHVVILNTPIGYDIPMMFKKLKGTNPRVISNLNSIQICQY